MSLLVHSFAALSNLLYCRTVGGLSYVYLGGLFSAGCYAATHLILYITDAPSMQKIIASYAHPYVQSSLAF